MKKKFKIVDQLLKTFIFFAFFFVFISFIAQSQQLQAVPPQVDQCGGCDPCESCVGGGYNRYWHCTHRGCPAATATPVPLPNPTNLIGSCPAPGTSATLSWSTVTGATGYYVRVDDKSNGWKNDCTVTQFQGDICLTNVITATSYTFTTTPGHTYSWWVHAANATAISPGTVQQSLVCAGSTAVEGDSNGDGVVDFLDYFYYISAKYGGGVPLTVKVDFNKDGAVDDKDRQILIPSLLKVLGL